MMGPDYTVQMHKADNGWVVSVYTPERIVGTMVTDTTQDGAQSPGAVVDALIAADKLEGTKPKTVPQKLNPAMNTAGVANTVYGYGTTYPGTIQEFEAQQEKLRAAQNIAQQSSKTGIFAAAMGNLQRVFK